MEGYIFMAGIIIAQDGVRAVGLTDFQDFNVVSSHDLAKHLIFGNDMMRSTLSQWPLS